MQVATKKRTKKEAANVSISNRLLVSANMITPKIKANEEKMKNPRSKKDLIAQQISNLESVQVVLTALAGAHYCSDVHPDLEDIRTVPEVQQILFGRRHFAEECMISIGITNDSEFRYVRNLLLDLVAVPDGPHFTGRKIGNMIGMLIDLAGLEEGMSVLNMSPEFPLIAQSLEKISKESNLFLDVQDAREMKSFDSFDRVIDLSVMSGNDIPRLKQGRAFLGIGGKMVSVISDEAYTGEIFTEKYSGWSRRLGSVSFPCRTVVVEKVQ